MLSIAGPHAHWRAARAIRPSRLSTLILPAAIVLLTSALIWPVVRHAFDIWAANDDLHFGFVILPLALVLVWFRRQSLARNMTHGSSQGLFIIVGAMVALFICERLWARSPAAVAVGLLLWGIVVYFWGWSAGRVLAFPITWLAVGLALQPTLLSGPGFVLQHITVIGAAAASNLAGVPVVREGLVLRTGSAAFIVAEACSGMNSLLALGTLAMLWLDIAGGSLGARAAGLAAVLPLVLIANVTRVSLVLVVGNIFGQDAAEGFFHGASSVVLFGMALGGFMLVGDLVGCRPFARA